MSEQLSSNDLVTLLRKWHALKGESCFREAADEIDCLTASLTTCRDLLAVIHGDGGHYTEAHGVEKSARDAMERVSRLMAERGQQMQHYVRHVEAMTAQGLYSKADIAAELAHRPTAERENGRVILLGATEVVGLDQTVDSSCDGMKRLYEMTGCELREEAEAAQARGDERRAQECLEQLALISRIADAFKARCSGPTSTDFGGGIAE